MGQACPRRPMATNVGCCSVVSACCGLLSLLRVTAVAPDESFLYFERPIDPKLFLLRLSSAGPNSRLEQCDCESRDRMQEASLFLRISLPKHDKRHRPALRLARYSFPLMVSSPRRNQCARNRRSAGGQSATVNEQSHVLSGPIRTCLMVMYGARSFSQ